MKTILKLSIVICLTAAFAGCGSHSPSFGPPQTVAQAEVPAPVIEAAKKAQPNVTTYERILKDHNDVYRLEGKAKNGDLVVVQVDIAGNVLPN